MAELKLLLFSFTAPLLLLLLAFILSSHRVIASLCFIAGFLWLYLPATPLVSYSLLEHWQKIPALDLDKPYESAQAIVILSGGYNLNIAEYPVERNVNTPTLVRLRYGAEVARSQKLPVLTSGGIFALNQQLSLSDQMAETLEHEFGISVKWREEKSTTTAENARFSADILQQQGIKSIILVTDALHMPRAVLSFERYGFNVLPAPTRFRKSYIRNIIFKLIPRASSFESSRRVLHEMLGYWVYKHFTLPGR